MTKSAKAKKAKKKDFQKAKLKVGKTKAKSDNFTDTSFRARSIAVLHQSLQARAPTSAAQFNHHLALLNHKAEAQRRDSLSHLINSLQTAKAQGITTPPAPVSAILPKIQPLFRDQSGAVRAHVVKLLAELPSVEVQNHVGQVLLHAQAAMTHMSVGIRTTGVEVLEWLLVELAEQVVSSAGGWVTTLQKFKLLFRWSSPADGGDASNVAKATPISIHTSQTGWQNTTSATAGKSTEEIKLLSKALSVFSTFLQAGLVSTRNLAAEEAALAAQCFPLHGTWQFLIPRTSNPFAHLNLFGPPLNEEGRAYVDAADRMDVFERRFRSGVADGLEGMRKEGGNIGRAATEAAKTLDRVIRHGNEVT